MWQNQTQKDILIIINTITKMTITITINILIDNSSRNRLTQKEIMRGSSHIILIPIIIIRDKDKENKLNTIMKDIPARGTPNMKTIIRIENQSNIIEMKIMTTSRITDKTTNLTSKTQEHLIIILMPNIQRTLKPRKTNRSIIDFILTFHFVII